MWSQCFLYEDISHNMRMAQGQFTSSCQVRPAVTIPFIAFCIVLQGLWSVLEGSRTFSMQRRELEGQCRADQGTCNDWPPLCSERWRELRTSRPAGSGSPLAQSQPQPQPPPGQPGQQLQLLPHEGRHPPGAGAAHCGGEPCLT